MPLGKVNFETSVFSDSSENLKDELPGYASRAWQSPHKMIRLGDTFKKNLK